jgi:hypothetical protein
MAEGFLLRHMICYPLINCLCALSEQQTGVLNWIGLTVFGIAAGAAFEDRTVGGALDNLLYEPGGQDHALGAGNHCIDREIGDVEILTAEDWYNERREQFTDYGPFCGLRADSCQGPYCLEKV